MAYFIWQLKGGDKQITVQADTPQQAALSMWQIAKLYFPEYLKARWTLTVSENAPEVRNRHQLKLTKGS